MNQKLKLVFYGTSEFAAKTLTALIKKSEFSVSLVVTQPDRVAGRGNKVQTSPVKEIAIANNLNLLQPENIKKNKSAFLDQLHSFGPFDVGVLVVYGQIIPLDVLEFPSAGTVNIHPSLLPRWRGAAPIRRAILAGDRETGVCLMKMEAGLDSGPVYTTEKTEIKENESAGELSERLCLIGIELLLKNLPAITSGQLKPTKQEDQGITYAEKIQKQDARINWDQEASKVILHIRAMNPEPGAFSFINKKRIKIFNAQLVDTSNHEHKSGSIVKLSENKLEVACQKGIISLSEVQLEGKRKNSITEFLKGIKLREDFEFGDF
ncbi:MAG: methionyl-tRNA formyltransferase, partial [Bdellovibrionales bacterium]|nr:methionyl-tRNA formyltransferase [Bdellovibrionales bacterium]